MNCDSCGVNVSTTGYLGGGVVLLSMLAAGAFFLRGVRGGGL